MLHFQGKTFLFFFLLVSTIWVGARDNVRFTLIEAIQDKSHFQGQFKVNIPEGFVLLPEDLSLQDTEQYQVQSVEFLNLREKTVYDIKQPVLSGENNKFTVHLEFIEEPAFPLSIDLIYQLCEDDVCHIPVEESIAITRDDISPGVISPTEEDRLDNNGWMTNLLGRSPIIVIFILFFIGLLSSLTPCIYPMIPITLGIIGIHSDNSVLWNFFRSFIFVTGMTISFSILGVLSAFTGFILGQWLGNIWFLLFITVLFVIMALTLFDIFTFAIPISNEFTKKYTGSWLSLIILGLVSGFLLSPCIGPVVIGILGLIAQTGNPGLGLLYMGVYGYGLGLPLIVLGTFAGTLSQLPRSGAWMIEIKKILGIMLYLVPLIFWFYYLPSSTFYILIAFFLFPLPFLTRYLKEYFLTVQENRLQIFKGVLSSLCFLGAFFFLIQGITLTAPTASPPPLHEDASLHWYHSVQEALPAAQKRNVPIFVNVTAPWCAYCHIYKEYFQEPEIQQLLKRYVLVELQYDSEIGEKYDIMGIPQLLFFSHQGEELEQARIIGLKSREEFITHLKETIQQYEGTDLSGQPS